MYIYVCILYSMLCTKYRPAFCIQGCDIARACEGYIISEDTNRGSYMQYIRPISILYTIYCISYA